MELKVMKFVCELSTLTQTMTGTGKTPSEAIAKAIDLLIVSQLLIDEQRCVSLDIKKLIIRKVEK